MGWHLRQQWDVSGQGAVVLTLHNNMTYIELFELAYSLGYPPVNTFTALQKKVTVAVAVAATNVLCEDPATDQHDKRLQWAQNVLRDVQAWGQQMIWGVLRVPAIVQTGASASDADVQTAVNDLVSQYAV